MNVDCGACLRLYSSHCRTFELLNERDIWRIRNAVLILLLINDLEDKVNDNYDYDK